MNILKPLPFDLERFRVSQDPFEKMTVMERVLWETRWWIKCKVKTFLSRWTDRFDDGLDVAPTSDLPKLLAGQSVEDVADAMVEWFFNNFEDPVQGMPWDSESGGYVYVMGGPYYARDELEDAFDEVATQEAIDKAADIIANDGWEWAPHSNRIHPANEIKQLYRD